MKKKLSVIIAATMTASLLVAGCGKEAEETKVEPKQETKQEVKKEEPKKEEAKPVTLNYVFWGETRQNEFFTEVNSLSEGFKKIMPNVTVDVEMIAAADYDTTMKIRNSANELPDVFPIRLVDMLNYKDIMVPLNDTEAAKNNKFADNFKLDGNVIGIPQISFNEYVYYRKSVFNELGLSVPTTWDELIEVSEKIKEDGKYIPFAIGAKDSWTNYPLNEFMPTLEAGDGNYLNVMASMDEPFAKGTPFYNAYAKIDKFYKAKCNGSDPLGYGWDQQTAMFAAKEAGMMAAGQWYLSGYLEAANNDDSDLGVFLLPTVEKKGDPIKVITMCEMFMGTPKSGEHTEEAKAFINWFFSDYYQAYADDAKITSTVKGIETDLGIFNQAFEGIDVDYVTSLPGNEEYARITNSIQFDVKAMGQEMIAGKDLDELMNEMNKKWKEAKNQ